MQSLVKNLGIRSKFQFESETAVFPLLTAGLVELPAIPSWILSLPQLLVSIEYKVKLVQCLFNRKHFTEQFLHNAHII